MPRVDERALRVGKFRALGLLGPVSSSFTLAWLGTHRKRLRTLLLGGKRLSVLVVWDTKAGQEVGHSDAEVEAIKQIVYGDAASA